MLQKSRDPKPYHLKYGLTIEKLCGKISGKLDKKICNLDLKLENYEKFVEKLKKTLRLLDDVGNSI